MTEGRTIRQHASCYGKGRHRANTEQPQRQSGTKCPRSDESREKQKQLGRFIKNQAESTAGAKQRRDRHKTSSRPGSGGHAVVQMQAGHNEPEMPTYRPCVAKVQVSTMKNECECEQMWLLEGSGVDSC